MRGVFARVSPLPCSGAGASLSMLAIVIVVLLAVLVYAWVGYPVLLAVLVRQQGRRHAAPPGWSRGGIADQGGPACRGPEMGGSGGEVGDTPTLLGGEGGERGVREGPRVAGRSGASGEGPGVPQRVPARSVDILFSAHNEEEHIAARLDNLLEAAAALSRSGMQVGIVVGADGCTDRTAAVAAEWARKHSRISVHESPERGGKAAMLKRLVARSRAELLVLTDANTEFAPGALNALLAPFRDPRVGGVCGRLALRTRNPSTSLRAGAERGTRDGGEEAAPESAYWSLETWMKQRESDLDSCLGANGAIYALRRELFWEDVPVNTIVDDFVIGMKVREQGYRMVYEPAALAEEELPDTAHEWARRVRIGSGDYQALALCRRCLLPRYGRFAWMFGSHKVLRWFTPHMLAGLVVAAAIRFQVSGFGCQGAEGEGLLSGSVLVGVGAAVCCMPVARMVRGTRLERSAWARPVLLTDHFLTMQAALLAGFVRFCRGGLKGYWTRTPRG